ncbi:protein of unknown function [Burkholderia multivorans]
MDRMGSHPQIKIPNRKPLIAIKEVVIYIDMNFAVGINIKASKIFSAIPDNQI